MIDTVRQWQKLRSANATDASFPSKVMTATEPTGSGVISVGTSGQVPSILQLQFFGAGNADTTLKARVIGWNYVSESSAGAGDGLWNPVVLAEFTLTLSTAVGVSGKVVANTDRLADTIELADGYNAAAVEVVSPTGNVPGHVQMDLKGHTKFEVTFDMNSSATSGNALYRLL